MVRVGYTTGVFDMFHIGHLNILRNSKLACDYLIVGVTTDELSIREKSKSPIIPFSERMAIVENIIHVDMVVPQSSFDKFEAWKNLRFNIMFVGDDWKGTEKWNNLEAQFRDVGVTVHYFPYTQHTSSSKLRQIVDKLSNEQD